MKRYNHAITVAFSIENTSEDSATNQELIDGLKKRIKDLEEDPENIQGAFDIFDTYEVDVKEHQNSPSIQDRLVEINIDVISPDGFEIDPTKTYSSKEQAQAALTEWMKRFERQGYYSSVQYGRIPLNELANYCNYVELDQDGRKIRIIED